MDNYILISLIVIFSGVIIAPLICRFFIKFSPWILSLIPLIVFVSLLMKVPWIAAGNISFESYKWAEALNISLQFNLDGLSFLFSLLISGIGVFVVIYGGSYLSGDKDLPKFYSYLFLFMGSMLGVVLSDNIFALFIFWELTSLSSYLLIGFRYNYESTRKAALQALLVTGTGGLALMAGLILISSAAGSANISVWMESGFTLADSKHLHLILVLILLGAFTKSAQFPFHFWLPNAMVAPTPVSAYLHSATMVKAGVYLIARLNPIWMGTTEWSTALVIGGGITMLTGAVWALFQSDLKKILAYTTISALGIMILMVGTGTPKAIQAGMVFLFAHALYKGGLFLVAGNVTHSTGTRDVTFISGLFRKMPFTGTAAALTSLSMAGFPLFIGFLGKELLYEAALSGWLSFLITPAIVFTGVIFASIALLLGWRVFFMKNTELVYEKVHEVSTGMYIGPLLLGVAGLLTGLLPGMSVEGFLSRASYSVSEAAGLLDMHLWHGFNIVLLLSMLTLLMGWLLYIFSGKRDIDKYILAIPERYGPEAVYESSWKKLLHVADLLIRFIQSGYLRFYIMTILITLIVLILFPVFYYQLFNVNLSLEGVESYEFILGALVFISIFFTVRAVSRLAAIAILGVAGYGIAIFFAIYGAPDLSMTQFLVETLTVVIFVFVLYKLPGYLKLSPGIHRLRDSIIAVTGGGTIAFVMLLITNYPLVSELKLFFSENSYLVAKGRNIVNVILVDFRALDTLGEITVLGIAAIGVFAMMKLRLSKKEK